MHAIAISSNLGDTGRSSVWRQRAAPHSGRFRAKKRRGRCAETLTVHAELGAAWGRCGVGCYVAYCFKAQAAHQPSGVTAKPGKMLQAPVSATNS